MGLYLVRDDVRGAVIILDEGIGLFGMITDEAFLFVAVGEPWTKHWLVFFQVYLIGVEVLDHLVQRFDAFLRVAFNTFSDFFNCRPFADTVGDICLMNHDGAEVTVENVGVEVSVFAGADGF